MRNIFAIAGGSVAGRDHRRAGRNNQDAFCFAQGEYATAAVVSDGCGSSMTSEIGAGLLARLAVRSLMVNARRFAPQYVESDREGAMRRLLVRVRSEILSALITLGVQLEESYPKAAEEHFLATLVGVFIAPWGVCTFTIGDGLIVCNEQVTVATPMFGNYPAYVAYALTNSAYWNFRPGDPTEFVLHAVCAAEDVESVLLGTDGALDLLAKEHELLPGSDEVLGPLSQFWTEPRFCKNRDAIRRRLVRAARETSSPERGIEAGLLRDDTTVVVVRRMKEGEV